MEHPLLYIYDLWYDANKLEGRCYTVFVQQVCEFLCRSIYDQSAVLEGFVWLHPLTMRRDRRIVVGTFLFETGVLGPYWLHINNNEKKKVTEVQKLKREKNREATIQPRDCTKFPNQSPSIHMGKFMFSSYDCYPNHLGIFFSTPNFFGKSIKQRSQKL